MGIKKHIFLFLFVALAWLGLYLIGLSSNYFITWNSAEKIILCLLGFFAIIPFLGTVVIILLKYDYLKTGLWIAFYASIVPLLFDYVVVGLIQGHGLDFIISHWYLSIAYAYVWVELPVIGLALKKLK